MKHPVGVRVGAPLSDRFGRQCQDVSTRFEANPFHETGYGVA